MEDLDLKIERAFKEKFVGNVVFSESEIKGILGRFEEKLRKYVNARGETMPESLDRPVFLLLVNIAKDWNSGEDAFWKFIYRKLLGTEEGGQKFYVYATSVIDRLGSKGDILYLSGSAKKYYATILVHAFAPLSSTEAFFDLCRQIYSEDLNSSFQPHDSVYAQAAEQLRNRLACIEDENQDLELGSTPYAFRAGLKGFATSDSTGMAAIVEDTVRDIDTLCDGGIIDTSGYYGQLLKKWWRKKEDTFGRKSERGPSERPVEDYSAITLRYVLSDTRVLLAVPPIRLRDNFDSMPVLTVRSGGETIHSGELLTAGSGLSMRTRPGQIDIADIVSGSSLADLSARIDHRGTEIYDSGKKLNRVFILFNNDREVNAQECEPGNYSLFVRDLGDLTQRPRAMQRTGVSLYGVSAAEGEVLQSSRRTVFFVNERRHRELRFKMTAKNDAVYRREGEDYTVVDGDVLVETDENLNAADYGIRYGDGDLVFRLTKFKDEVAGGARRFSVSELLNGGESGKLSVFRYSDGKPVAAINVLKFNDIRVSYDRDLYYGGDSAGTVRFTTELYDRKASFDVSRDEITLPFKEGELCLRPPVLRWRIDDGAWHASRAEKGIWYKTMTNASVLSVEIPPSFDYDVLLSDGSSVPRDESGSGRWRLGEKIHSLLNRRDCPEEISVSVRVSREEGARDFPVAVFFLKPHFRDRPYEKSGDYSLTWNPESFAGPEESRFVLSLKNGRVKLNFTLGTEKKTLCLKGLGQDHYTVRVTKPSGIPVAKNEELLFPEESIFVGNEKIVRYLNKELHVTAAMRSGEDSRTKIRGCVVKNLKFLGTRDGFDFYSGKIYQKDRFGNLRYMDRMLSDDGEPEDINPVRVEMRNDETCWIVYGFKSPDLNDFIAEFTMDAFGQLSNKANNDYTVDYYCFKTENGRQ